MTQKLSGPLSEVEQQQALTLAQQVGYLPLALDLATSQVEEGVSWAELLEDLQAEVVRLEALDRFSQADIPEAARRRKYSLLACFNLSLQQLSPEQLRQFAWLGVVPEDVNLTQAMAATLWQVTSRQAGAILRQFRAKTLLLSGAKETGQPASYRLHDLMHDLAQRLLQSPPQPLKQEDLPGLGLTKAEAHQQLLERYRGTTQRGQWHTLADDGYIYAHLSWHMEQAQQPEVVHQLLQETTAAGRNGWYEACEAIGKPAGFVNDVGRAWRLAREQFAAAPAATVSHLFRYALMRTSINSLASNVPPELLGALVKAAIWQPAQGLAYAQQVQNPGKRAACLVQLVPYLPAALLPEVLKTVGQMTDASYRSFVLSHFAERYPHLWPEVLAAMRQIPGRYGEYIHDKHGFSSQAGAISQVAPQLPPELWSEALEMTRQLQDDSERAWALRALAQQSPELLSEALALARQLQDDTQRAMALRELAQQSPELLSEALEMTRQIQDGFDRAIVLRDLAEQLPPELLSEAQGMLQAFTSKYYRATAWQGFLARLEELSPNFSCFVDILETLAYLNRSQLLINLPHLRDTLIRLGGQEGFEGCLQAMREVCQQW